jgi:hypothetical protein
MSTSVGDRDAARAAARDEVALLTRSLEDARSEYARGELDDVALSAIERRDGQRLTAATARLAALDDATPPEEVVRAPAAPRRRPRWLLAVAAACAVAVALVVTDPFGSAPTPPQVTRTTTLVGLLAAGEEALGQSPPSLSVALTAFDAARALAPRNAEALVESGWCRYLLGHDRGDLAQERLGAAVLRRAVHVVPLSAAAHLYDGIVLWRLDHDRTAAYREVLRAAHLRESGAVSYAIATMLSVLAPSR